VNSSKNKNRDIVCVVPKIKSKKPNQKDVEILANMSVLISQLSDDSHKVAFQETWSKIYESVDPDSFKLACRFS